jgi:hypothetical protein
MAGKSNTGNAISIEPPAKQTTNFSTEAFLELLVFIQEDHASCPGIKKPLIKTNQMA